METVEGLFELATAVTRAEDGSYRAELVQSLTIDGVRPNGGYLLALIGRAATAAAIDAGSTHPHPVAATAQYLSAPALGPARIEVDVLRVGRTASQVEARLVQESGTCVQALFVIGRLSEGAEPYWSRESPFELADGEAMDFRAGQNRPPSMYLTVEERFDPRCLGTEEAPPELPAELRAWMRFVDGAQPDVFALLLATDALPPAAWGLGLSGWVPTLQLTAYVRALPAPGPLRIRQMARLVQDGLLDETCEVWDSSDHLVAQATQLAAFRMPSGG